jgi:hypothetical protein
VLRPALADKQGRALFIGTPRGYNHFYDLYQAVQGQAQWTTFQFTTEQGGNVSKDELQNATQELDERTYQQEFQASFENLTSGLVYYAFDRSSNLRETNYDARRPLFWSLDFNIHPMCSVIGQREGDGVHVLDELVLPDSNTGAACEEFLARTARWVMGSHLPIQLNIYGDATGNGRQSAASRTDWQLIREFFNRHRDLFRASILVPTSNPAVKDRVNCVNAMLRNQAGIARLFIDPRCKQLIQDFERVHWKTDPTGNLLSEIDKSDPARTHVSDALGYLIAKEFPIYPTARFHSEPLF